MGGGGGGGGGGGAAAPLALPPPPTFFADINYRRSILMHVIRNTSKEVRLLFFYHLKL